MLRQVMVGALVLGGLALAESDAVVSTNEVQTGSVKGELLSSKRVRSRGTTSEADLVVWLEREDGKPVALSEATKIKVKQIKREFVPHVQAVQVGTVVEFDNSDSIRHNILANDSCCKVDSDLEEGEFLDVTFDTPGVSSLLCRLHPEMSMYVVVSPTPYFAQARLESTKGADGKKVYKTEYEIGDVPPGKYKLHVWSKKLDQQTQEIEVTAGEATELNLNW